MKRFSELDSSSSKKVYLPPSSFILWSPSYVAYLKSVGIMGRLVGQRTLHNKASKYSTSAKFGFPFYLSYYPHKNCKRVKCKEIMRQRHSPCPSNFGNRDTYVINWKQKDNRRNRKRNRIQIEDGEKNKSIDLDLAVRTNSCLEQETIIDDSDYCSNLPWVVYQDLWDQSMNDGQERDRREIEEQDESENMLWERKKNGKAFWWLRCGAAYGSHFMIYDNDPDYSHAPVGVLVLIPSNQFDFSFRANFVSRIQASGGGEKYLEEGFTKKQEKNKNALCEPNRKSSDFPFEKKGAIFTNLDSVQRKTYGQLVPHLRLLHTSNKRLVLACPIEPLSKVVNTDSSSLEMLSYLNRGIDEEEGESMMNSSDGANEVAYITLNHVAFYSS